MVVALGNDDMNINTAVNLRMYFERLKIHPVIQAIVYNSQQKKALKDINNYRGQEYDIEFIGDVESSYTEDVIIDYELVSDFKRIRAKQEGKVIYTKDELLACIRTSLGGRAAEIAYYG